MCEFHNEMINSITRIISSQNSSTSCILEELETPFNIKIISLKELVLSNIHKFVYFINLYHTYIEGALL